MSDKKVTFNGEQVFVHQVIIKKNSLDIHQGEKILTISLGPHTPDQLEHGAFLYAQRAAAYLAAAETLRDLETQELDKERNETAKSLGYNSYRTLDKVGQSIVDEVMGLRKEVTRLRKEMR